MKKTLLIAMVLLLAIAIAACGNNDGDSTITPNNEAATTPVDPAPTPATTGDDATDAPTAVAGAPDFDPDNPLPFLDYHFPATDLGGITLRMSGMGDPDTDNPEERERMAANIARVEERFNVNLDFSHHNIQEMAGSWSDVPEFIIASVAAGDPVTNIFRGSAGYWFGALAANDAATPMTDYFRNNVPQQWWAGLGEARGNIYGIQPNNYSWLYLVYNREMIRDAGMEFSPQEMFINGRWSWDDFYDYAMELRTLIPAEAEVIGMHLSHWKRMGTLSNGAYILHPVTNVPGMLDDAYIEFANFTQRLVQDQLWRQPGFIPYGTEGVTGVPPEGQWSFIESWMDNPASHHALFREGLMAFTMHHPWNMHDTAAQLEFGVVPFPWGPRVSWPDSGDWRDLKVANPGLYNSPTHDTNNHILIAGSPAEVTPEVFINLLVTFNPTWARDFVLDMEIQRTGAPPRLVTPGGAHELFTDLDRELYSWYGSNPQWEPMDASQGFWAGAGAYSRLWQGTLALGGDFRPVFESVVGPIMVSLMDFGVLNDADVPAHLRPFVEEAIANQVDED